MWVHRTSAVQRILVRERKLWRVKVPERWCWCWCNPIRPRQVPEYIFLIGPLGLLPTQRKIDSRDPPIASWLVQSHHLVLATQYTSWTDPGSQFDIQPRSLCHLRQISDHIRIFPAMLDLPMLNPLAARIPDTRDKTPGSFCTRQLKVCLYRIPAFR